MKLTGRVSLTVIILLLFSVSLCKGQSVIGNNINKGVDFATRHNFKDAKNEFGKVLEVEPFSESTKRLLKVIEDITDKKICSPY